MSRVSKFIFWTIMMAVTCCISVWMQSGLENKLLARCRHLDAYQYFHNYNQNHFFEPFVITEIWKSGKPYYKLVEPEEKIACIVNQEETQATVHYLGKSISFPIGGFLSTNANVYLVDLTNDGFHELLYEETMSGEEGNRISCVVVELKTMQVLKIKDCFDTLLGSVTVEKVREEGDRTLCKVTDNNHHIYFGSIEGTNIGDAKESVKISDCQTVEFDYASGKLRAYVCFTLSGYEKGDFLGDISAYYTYQSQTNEFELQKEYCVSIWNPKSV